MAKGQKRTLPLAPADAGPTPVDVARKKLGGRAASEPGQGRVVSVSVGSARVVGVILFSAAEDVLVLVEASVVRKTRRDALLPLVGEPPEEILRLSGDVRVFARLAEGDRVRYEAGEGTMREGRLLEKCKYGGLVAAEGGAVVAVGFRKLWPAVAKDEAPS